MGPKEYIALFCEVQLLSIRSRSAKPSVQKPELCVVFDVNFLRVGHCSGSLQPPQKWHQADANADAYDSMIVPKKHPLEPVHFLN